MTITFLHSCSYEAVDSVTGWVKAFLPFNNVIKQKGTVQNIPGTKPEFWENFA